MKQALGRAAANWRRIMPCPSRASIPPILPRRRRRAVPGVRAARSSADGYFYILDRSKDMIVTGGENVYSGEVEAVIYQHPSVLEAAVFGIPDPQWGSSSRHA